MGLSSQKTRRGLNFFGKQAGFPLNLLAAFHPTSCQSTVCYLRKGTGLTKIPSRLLQQKLDKRRNINFNLPLNQLANQNWFFFNTIVWNSFIKAPINILLWVDYHSKLIFWVWCLHRKPYGLKQAESAKTFVFFLSNQPGVLQNDRLNLYHEGVNRRFPPVNSYWIVKFCVPFVARKTLFVENDKNCISEKFVLTLFASKQPCGFGPSSSQSTSFDFCKWWFNSHIFRFDFFGENMIGRSWQNFVWVWMILLSIKLFPSLNGWIYSIKISLEKFAFFRRGLKKYLRLCLLLRSPWIDTALNCRKHWWRWFWKWRTLEN